MSVPAVFMLQQRNWPQNQADCWKIGRKGCGGGGDGGFGTLFALICWACVQAVCLFLCCCRAATYSPSVAAPILSD